jgi:tripartite-type tricarboxylate transporter receptor subunit TctC
VAKSEPDGHTLFLTTVGAVAITPGMRTDLPYDTMRDFAPISVLMAAPFVLTVHPSVPAKSVKELIALAKAQPGRLVIGSAGLGTSPHLAGELFKIMAGVDMPQVLFKGSGQGLISLLSGEIAVMFPSTVSVIAHMKTGKLRALGVTSARRVEALPQMPSIAEAALPGYEATQWYGVLARAGTPRPIIDRLNQEMNRISGTPEMKERLAAEGAEASGTTPEEFARLIQTETEKWAKVIKQAGIKPE